MSRLSQWVYATKFPPMFTYKKEKNGNYTVGGMAKDLMDDMKDYMNIRFAQTLHI